METSQGIEEKTVENTEVEIEISPEKINVNRNVSDYEEEKHEKIRGRDFSDCSNLVCFSRNI